MVMVERASLQPVWRLPADGITTLGQAGLTFDFTQLPILTGFPVDTWPSEVAFSPDGTTPPRPCRLAELAGRRDGRTQGPLRAL